MAVEDLLDMRLMSQTMVRPEEPTDEGRLFLSNLEQLLAFYVHTVYMYPHVPGSTAAGRDVVEILRSALAKVLVPYHFMAGRLRMNESEERLEVQYSRDGVLFCHAETKCTFADLGTLDFLNRLLTSLTPHSKLRRHDQHLLDNPLMIIQVTTFSCGGFSVGLSIMHAMLDGISADVFLSQYASIARGDGLNIRHPSIHKEALRARNPPRVTHEHPELVKLSDLSSTSLSEVLNLMHVPDKQWKSFHFTSKMINGLKNKCLKEGGLAKCSSFEALTAYIWKARTEAIDMDQNHVSQLTFMVDFRQKFNPPLPDELIGNAVVSPCVRMSAGEIVESPLWRCVKEIQEAKSKVTEGYVRSTIDWLQLNKGATVCLEGIVVSTWSRLSLLNLDFGWGEPAYSGPILHVEQLKETVIFLPKKQQHDQGMDVCLALQEHKMAKFAEMFQKLCEMVA